MNPPTRDIWAEWLLERRSGGDPEWRRAQLERIGVFRDRVLDNARIVPGETLLDLGSGDGLIPFGALDRLGERGTVIFSDISRDLLEHSEQLAAEIGVQDRCRFVEMAADDLGPIGDASVDIVTTRSVLIYVDDKQRAFDEIHRVLRPGGRLSIFEPINGYRWPEPPGRFMQMDTGPVASLAEKITAYLHREWPPETDSMLNFDERDLVSFAERAGFREVHLELRIDSSPAEALPWEIFTNAAWNPRMPTLNELIERALTAEEAERFVAYLRPVYESPDRRWSMAVAYLWAGK